MSQKYLPVNYALNCAKIIKNDVYCIVNRTVPIARGLISASYSPYFAFQSVNSLDKKSRDSDSLADIVLHSFGGLAHSVAIGFHLAGANGFYYDGMPRGTLIATLLTTNTLSYLIDVSRRAKE